MLRYDGRQVTDPARNRLVDAYVGCLTRLEAVAASQTLSGGPGDYDTVVELDTAAAAPPPWSTVQTTPSTFRGVRAGLQASSLCVSVRVL